MGRQPCCDKVGLKKGPWTSDEDRKLINFILTNGQCCWRAVPKLAGLLRCGKSCRLRWTNYLRPDLKRGLLSEDEEKLVIDLHAQLGNRWSKIASHLSGRTDNEIKNHWNTHIKKKLKKQGIDPVTHQSLPSNTTTTTTTTTTPPPHQPPPPPPPSAWGILEMETSVESTHDRKEQEEGDNSSGIPFDSSEENINGFSTEEVPLIEPHEILIPFDISPPTSSSSSASSASSTFSSDSAGSAITILEELKKFPTFDWDSELITENMGFWEEDLRCLDLLMNGDNEGNANDIQNIPITQCTRMAMEEAFWNFELL